MSVLKLNYMTNSLIRTFYVVTIQYTLCNQKFAYVVPKNQFKFVVKNFTIHVIVQMHL